MHIPLLSDAFGWAFKYLFMFAQENYLITLFLFALIMKLLLLPFGIMQQKNSIKQAKMRPKEMAIRRKYAGRNDKATQQKLNEEIMQLYQEERINPMSGCLPLLIQMPILFALYDVIRNPLTYILNYSKDVVQNLGKLVDLSGKNLDQIKIMNKLVEYKGEFNVEGADLERILDLKNSFSIASFDFSVIPMEKWGIYIIIPVLTFAFSFLSTKLIRKFTYQPQMQQDASSSASMKIMDFMMPLMSVWISVIVSSAIGVYWMFQNILSAVQQIILFKLFPVPPVTEEQIKEAELALKGKQSKKKQEYVAADYEIDDYDKTVESDKSGSKNQKDTKNSVAVRKTGINPKVKELTKKGVKLTARRKI